MRSQAGVRGSVVTTRNDEESPALISGWVRDSGIMLTHEREFGGRHIGNAGTTGRRASTVKMWTQVVSQAGGKGQYGHVASLEPYRQDGFPVRRATKGGVVRGVIPAVEKGVRKP